MKLVILLCLVLFIIGVYLMVSAVQARRQRSLQQSPWSARVKYLNGGATIELFRDGHRGSEVFETLTRAQVENLEVEDALLRAEQAAADRNHARQLEQTINRRQARLYS